MTGPKNMDVINVQPLLVKAGDSCMKIIMLLLFFIFIKKLCQGVSNEENPPQVTKAGSYPLLTTATCRLYSPVCV